jgi:uncharacterized protein (TIGR02598 family)
MKNPPARPDRRDAFSLVEVVLSVGVAAFALMALLGLLPAGLKTFKGTMNSAVGAQIAQRIFNDMQVSDWSNISNMMRYFDEQGTETTMSNDLHCIYWAQVTVTNAVTSTNSTSIMGNTSTNLLTLRVIVANNPGGAQPASTLFSPSNPNSMTFTTLIGRSR